MFLVPENRVDSQDVACKRGALSCTWMWLANIKGSSS